MTRDETEGAPQFKLTLNKQTGTVHLSISSPDKCHLALVLRKALYLCVAYETVTTQTPFLLFKVQWSQMWDPSVKSKHMKKTMADRVKEQACVLQ